MPAFRTLDELPVADKTVLVRADLNVPTANGTITDDTRIVRFAPTARELAEKGAKVVILSHFGRPKDGPSAEFSQAFLADPLAKAIGRPVTFAKDCVGSVAESAVAALKPGEIVLLENVRFHKEEEKNDTCFAKSLAALGDVYVNDAFSAAHRAHASTEHLARFLPAAAGRLMQAELEALTRALENPQRPVMAVVGGSKVSTKIEVLTNLAKKVDCLVIGGAMANTFLLAKGIEVGKSLAERDFVQTAKDIMAAGCEILLPEDVVVAETLKPGVATQVVSASAIPADKMALDVGPASVAAFKAKLASMKTVVWNGPLGAFEIPPFEQATVAAAQEVARLTKEGKLCSVAGGGDTVAALEAAGCAGEFSYVSSAGGAFLEWLEGKTLPGVAALSA
jgi:phosphoglycerate kinase